MKYVFLLITVAVVCLYMTRLAHESVVVQEVTQQEAVPLSSGPRGQATAPGATPVVQTNSLKRPIDRTREVLSQVKQRNGQGEF